MFRNRSVDVHQFSMVPRADVPRSQFKIQKGYKTTFDSGYLIPVYVDEVLPGDTFNVRMTSFCRLATPLVPIMDNLHLDSFFFFIPNRLLWDNWQRFMGEQIDPGDSTDFLVPQMESPLGGYAVGSLQDYMGLPTVGQVDPTGKVSHCAFWTRAYNLVWNEWFRDQNLQDSLVVDRDDGPDDPADYVLQRRGKRHDYFTSALPFAQKGNTVGLPLTGIAPVVPASSSAYPSFKTDQNPGGSFAFDSQVTGQGVGWQGPAQTLQQAFRWLDTGLVADLGAATAATINQLRQSFQIQKLLERDARGGTRYTEIVRSHFGVISPDARLQRPEYLGGGSTQVAINPIAQTSGSPGAGAYTDTPQGHLAAMGTALARGHGFSQSFTEHGIVLGLVSVRADLSYQQGLRRMWSRRTRYDFYFPVFSHLGEQTVLQKEIFCKGLPADDTVFGYQERWAEYRHNPSEITGQFRSTASAPLDIWHLAQAFTSAPTLNATFIEDRPPLQRVLAVGASAAGQEFLGDFFFEGRLARPLPMYSVPGLIDHF